MRLYPVIRNLWSKNSKERRVQDGHAEGVFYDEYYIKVNVNSVLLVSEWYYLICVCNVVEQLLRRELRSCPLIVQFSCCGDF